MSIKSKWRTALSRSGHWMCVVVVAAASASGCASYKSSPLVRAELVRALGERSAESEDLRKSAPASYSPDDGLSLPEAEAVALFFNSSLRAERLKAQVSVVSATKAGLWDDPELGFDVAKILKPEPLQDPWILGSSLAFTIPVSGRLSLEQARAGSEGRAAIVHAWVEEQRILRELREAWVEWEKATRSANASRELFSRLERVVEITERLEKSGELIAAEGVAFRLTRARWSLDLESLEATEASARLKLLAMMGLTPDARVVLTPSRVPGEAPATPSREQLLSANPGIRLSEVEYEVAERTLRLEVRRQYPDVQIGPSAGKEDGQHQLGVGFSVPLPILNANRRAIVEASASREAARGAWEQAVHSALGELASSQARLAASERRRLSYTETIIPLADTQLASAQRMAEQGEVNALLLLEALDAQREATLGAIEVEAGIAREAAIIRSLAPVETRANEGSPALKGPSK